MTWVVIAVVAGQMYMLEERWRIPESCKAHGELIAKQYPNITAWECVGLISEDQQ